MRRLLLSLASAGILLALPATALAAGPVRETAVFDFPPAVFGECDGFDLIATVAHIERETLTWYDADGNPLRESRHAFFDFTLVNSATGTEGRYVGRFHRTADFVTGADGLYGAYRQLFINHRNVWSASGVDAWDGISEITSHGSMSLLEWEEGLCAAMA